MDNLSKVETNINNALLQLDHYHHFSFKSSSEFGHSNRKDTTELPTKIEIHNTLYSEYIKYYQIKHNLQENDYSFSEQQLFDFFYKKDFGFTQYILGSIKHSVIIHKNNRLVDFIRLRSKLRNRPIELRSFEIALFGTFINFGTILNTPLNLNNDQGLTTRSLEINQMVQLLNILADTLYINKFDLNIRFGRIEKNIREKKDTQYSDDYLIAYRLGKEEILYNLMQHLKMFITSYFKQSGTVINQENIFQTQFDDQLWVYIKNFVQNVSQLSLWKTRSNAACNLFSGINHYAYWGEIFETGKYEDNTPILNKPLNIDELIKSS
jgi:hypothetical protein